MTQQVNRKDEHIQHALEQFVQESAPEFAQTQFVHHSFPEIAYEDVDIHTNLDTLLLSAPFFINAMTGGSQKAYDINRQLAFIAKETDIPLATGSVSVALKEPDTAESFRVVRQINPNGLIFANLGAHHSVENAKRAVDLLEADALQIHVNTPQEMVMPEGERDFTGWLHHIEQIVAELNIPIIVKEVGFGMSKETVTQLTNIGVRIIDISGKGGTNFVDIENNRRITPSYNMLSAWGQSTLISLLEAQSVPHPTLIASGGIKNALDITKCIALGANAVGLSGQILYLLERHGVEQTINYIHRTKEHIRTIMTLLGAKNISELQQKAVVVAPTIQNWCHARHIDWQYFANRN
ncbi:type 2 isopentenyl-diphosphate Delta-isomerase [Carnobacteriaceae bacterium zg-ZUI78]|nr:type 2 isopentenyl-diphosphate Delta-isomerase [Carnobacteriaceae bacterium zg-ZUI78]